MADLAAKKKERNYLLDVLKLVAALFVIMFHFAIRLYGGFKIYPANDLSQAYYWWYAEFGPFKNVMTMAFYTFTSGYWLMQRIYKEKRAGFFGRGKDLSMVGKYFVSNFATYWPYLFIGGLWGIACLFIAHPTLMENPMNIVYAIKNAMFDLLGLQSAGYMGYSESLFAHACNDLSALTNNYTDMSTVFIKYNSPLWYLSAMVVFAPIIYIVFMKSELAGIVMSIVIYSCGNGWLSMNGSGGTSVISADILFVGKCAMRLLTPMMLGIWGFYLAEYLKKAKLSDKGRTWISIFGVFGAVWFLFLAINGSGYIMMDYPVALLLVMMFSGQGKITPAVNKVLAKIPGIKSLSNISLGLYILHTPLLCVFKFRLMDSFANLSQMQIFGIFMAALIVLYIPFYLINKYALVKITKGIISVFKANEPPVFDDVKPAVAEAK